MTSTWSEDDKAELKDAILYALKAFKKNNDRGADLIRIALADLDPALVCKEAESDSELFNLLQRAFLIREEAIEEALGDIEARREELEVELEELRETYGKLVPEERPTEASAA